MENNSILFFTIVLDGMPFLPLIYAELRKLNFEWDWWVCEGVANNVSDTYWCSSEVPRLSRDGTNEYLRSLSGFDKRVHHVGKEIWPGGKVQMCNEPLRRLQESRLLWQIDSDEIWTAEQIVKMRRLFIRNPIKNCAYFRCRYFLGPDIVITSREGYGNYSQYEWWRVWRISPGARFKRHEPPVIDHFTPIPFDQSETEKEGLVFDHFAYATKSQVAFKETYYGSSNNKNGHLYRGAVKGWENLQSNTEWPVKVDAFLPWVGDGVTANKIQMP